MQSADAFFISSCHQTSRLFCIFTSQFVLLRTITFFTVGKKEVRAWTIKNGSKAPQAGAAIHSDFEKGFIKAEVMAYNDFVACGSEAAFKDKGLLRVEGKEYVVQDGDVMHFRFAL